MYKSMFNISYLEVLFKNFFDINISIEIDNKLKTFFEYKDDKYYFKYNYLEYTTLLKFLSLFDMYIDKNKLYTFLNYLRVEFDTIIDDYQQINNLNY